MVRRDVWAGIYIVATRPSMVPFHDDEQFAAGRVAYTLQADAS